MLPQVKPLKTKKRKRKDGASKKESRKKRSSQKEESKKVTYTDHFKQQVSIAQQFVKRELKP